MALRESSLLLSFGRGLGIALYALQEKKGLISLLWGYLVLYFELQSVWGFSRLRQGTQVASGVTPWKSSPHSSCKGQCGIALESR